MSINENLLGSLSEENNGEDQSAAAQDRIRQARLEALRRDVLAEDFRGSIQNIYEAVLVLSTRARQIGQQQANIIEQFLASKIKPDTEETEEEVPVAKPAEDDDDAPRLPRFEKPTVLAMNELLRGELTYKLKE
jgi:DNA-directed RNA polymerase subunit K/omega